MRWYIAPEQRLALVRELGFLTNDFQDAVVRAPQRNVIVRAARRVGKSLTMVKRHFPLTLSPHSVHWIVAPTYDLAEKEFRYFVEGFQRLAQRFSRPFREVVPKLRQTPETGDLRLETEWGAQVVGKSATNQFSLVGEACDSVILAEAAQLTARVWERYVRPTLSTTEGYAAFGSTPDVAGEWLYRLEAHARQYPRDWALFHQAAWDCPHYSREEIEAARQALSEDAFYEQYGGEWRFYTGRVYKVFKPDVHLVEPFPIPSAWRVFAAVDWGATRDPTAALWAVQSPTGEAYVVGEYYVAGAGYSTEDHVRALLRTEEALGLTGRVVRIADHHGLGQQLILNASRAGYRTVPCRSEDRVARRDAAIAAFTPRPQQQPYHVREAGHPPGEYPRVFLFKGRCPHYVEELLFLRWKETTRPEGSVGTTEGADHLIDCGEYLCDYFGLGAIGRRRRATAKPSPRPVAYDPTGYYSWVANEARPRMPRPPRRSVYVPGPWPFGPGGRHTIVR